MAGKFPMSQNVELETVAMDGRLQGFSGADLASLLREAAVQAMSEFFVRTAGSKPRTPRAKFRNVRPGIRILNHSASKP